MNDKANLTSWTGKIDWRIRQFQHLKDHHQPVFAAITLMSAALKQGNKILARKAGPNEVDDLFEVFH